MTTQTLSAPANAFTVTLQTRWSDQDLNGHVNNAKLVTLFEEARVRADQQWAHELGGETSVGARVVRAMSMDFVRPVFADASVDVAVWVSRIGRTSFTMVGVLSQRGEHCATQEATIVMLDAQTGRPVEVPEQLRAQLEKVTAQ